MLFGLCFLWVVAPPPDPVGARNSSQATTTSARLGTLTSLVLHKIAVPPSQGTRGLAPPEDYATNQTALPHRRPAPTTAPPAPPGTNRRYRRPHRLAGRRPRIPSLLHRRALAHPPAPAGRHHPTLETKPETLPSEHLAMDSRAGGQHLAPLDSLAQAQAASALTETKLDADSDTNAPPLVVDSLPSVPHLAFLPDLALGRRPDLPDAAVCAPARASPPLTPCSTLGGNSATAANPTCLHLRL